MTNNHQSIELVTDYPTDVTLVYINDFAETQVGPVSVDCNSYWQLSAVKVALKELVNLANWSISGIVAAQEFIVLSSLNMLLLRSKKGLR